MNRDEFSKLIPSFPFCTDDSEKGIYRQPKERALTKLLIQPNTANLIRWLTFDIDRPDAWYAWEYGKLPYPNFIAVNKENGHAHIAYELAAPVSISTNSSQEAVEFLKAVQRGFTRRLRADGGYSGTIVKNPVHAHWLTDWPAKRSYELSELDDSLDRSDKKRFKAVGPTGLGRNCTIFDQLREVSYRQVLIFKKAGKTEVHFRKFLENVAVDLNRSFETPLFLQELAQIAKSVAKWTWDEFSLEKFSAIQAARGRKAWSKTLTLTDSKPWEAEGISRASWYRKRVRQKPYQDIDAGLPESEPSGSLSP